MSLYDTIAASHRGQCFALLARRFRLDEVQVADVVYWSLRELTASLSDCLSDRRRLSAFLTDLSKGDYLPVLVDDSVFSDQVRRDRGARLISVIQTARPLNMATLDDEAQATGANVDAAHRMLPYIALLMMAAIRHRAERPLRHIMAARRGAMRGASTGCPFQALADSLAQPVDPQPRQRVPLRLVDSIFGRPSRTLPEAAE